jgi:hypothetical protein
LTKQSIALQPDAMWWTALEREVEKRALSKKGVDLQWF